MEVAILHDTWECITHDIARILDKGEFKEKYYEN